MFWFFFLLYTLNGYTINAFLWSFRDHNNSIFPLYDQELGWRNLKNISDFFSLVAQDEKKQIVNLPCYLVLKKFAWKKNRCFFFSCRWFCFDAVTNKLKRPFTSLVETHMRFAHDFNRDTVTNYHECVIFYDHHKTWEEKKKRVSKICRIQYKLLYMLTDWISTGWIQCA